MQFLVLTRRKTEEFTIEEFSKLFEAEVSKAKELYAEGFTRQIWHRADGNGACQIVEGEDETEVRGRINTLPFAQLKMLDISIIALKPYVGFSR